MKRKEMVLARERDAFGLLAHVTQGNIAYELLVVKGKEFSLV
jgi:hypothetical protein